MPRKPAINPTKEFKFYASLENTAFIELMCYDPATARNKFGEVSKLVNEALTHYRQFLKEQQNARQS